MRLPGLRRSLAAVALCAGLAASGCQRPQPAAQEQSTTAAAAPTPPAARTPLPTDAWIGKWVGVEGLVLDIQPRGAAGRYRLYVTLMDGSADYAGVADGDVIRFVRDGKPETIRHVSGAETGLKWLDGKRDCLMIVTGEGFCRDKASSSPA